MDGSEGTGMKSFVIHNLPETSEEQDVKSALEIMEEIIQKDVEHDLDRDMVTNKPKIYRIGRKTNSKVRTMKIHMQSEELCRQILSNSRRLSNSTKYKMVVVQNDLTLLERRHLKQLVLEKRRRNDMAKSQDEEPNWTIRDGVLFRRS